LLKLLAAGPLPRAGIVRKLGVNQRGFYRDVEVLRGCGILIRPRDGRYELTGGFAAALDRLPLPDPRLTLGQAQRLARGRTPAHRTLRDHIARITGGG
jgi:hypothetical protein